MLRYKLRTLLIVLAIGPMVLAWAQDNSDPGKALYGEWEVVEMILGGKVQDFGGGNGGWFLFEPGGYIRYFDASQRDDVKNGKAPRSTIRWGMAVPFKRQCGTWNWRGNISKCIWSSRVVIRISVHDFD